MIEPIEQMLSATMSVLRIILSIAFSACMLALMAKVTFLIFNHVFGVNIIHWITR